MTARAQTLVCFATLLCLAGATRMNAQQSALGSGALTPVPRVVWFSGSFHPADGQPIAQVETVTVVAYRDQQGGDPLWQETQSIVVGKDGRYNLLLGSTSTDGLPPDLFTTGEPRWIGIKFERTGEVEQPRVLLASVPYALKAADADTLGGKPASAYVLAEPASSSGGPGARVSRTARSSTTTNRPHATTATVGTPGFLGVFVDSSNLGNSSLFQNGAGLIGLGTLTPADAMHVQFTNTTGTMTGLAVQNLGGTATSYSGMLFYDQNGALGQFQGFNNSTHEYRINNIASAGSINFMIGSSSKFLVTNSGNIGISNAAPAFKLDVAGDVNATGAFKIGGNPVITSSTNGNTVTIGTSCTNYSSAGQVTVTTTPGHTVEIVGTVWLRLNHTSGTKDAGQVVVGTTPTDCGGASAPYWAQFQVSSSDATDLVNVSVPFRAVFATPGSPGPVTYYLNAIMSSGQDVNDVFWFGNMTAHVY